MGDDLPGEYDRYLTRFDDNAGDTAVDVGEFAKYRGRLIRKLTFDEFTARWGQYHELASHYFECFDRGDTINDVVVRALRDHAAELVLASPV